MAAYVCSSFFVALFFFRTIYSQAVDPCTNHKVINDVYRSTKYQLQSGIAAKCDNQLTTGWYRFNSIVGGMMPETKPSPNHCGTAAPIWIRDTHPTAKGQQKDVTACTNIRNMMNGCVINHKISIKNCGGFYVYKLKRIYGCPAAYCAGNKEPCPKGQVGIVPNCRVSIIDHFPSGLLPTPTITYRTPVDPLTMLCKFNFPNWKNVSFGIEWFTDGYSVKNETICSDKSGNDCLKRYGELPALHPDQVRSYFKPGHRVHCKLRMRYNTNVDNKWTTITKQSSQYFVGIKVVASHQNGRLKECNKDTRITVTFTPTVPIVDDANKQHLSIKILVPIHGQLQTSSAVDTCDLKLPHGMLPSESRKITITPVCDNINQATGSMEYRFVIADFWQRFWLMYKLPSVKVTIENTPQHQCSATGDPHYTSFDGRYYDFMPVGDYVLYKNTFTDTEVHARAWLCSRGSSVTCNCGVAIREGADIIIFSVCNTILFREARLLKTDIRSEGGLAPGTHIFRTVQGSTVTHNVFLPSGNRVKVERYDWGLNLYVKAMSPKPNRIFGLCGNFNGRQDDEFHHGGDNQQHGDPVSFGNSWRLDPSKSNFNLRLPAPTMPPTAILPKYCECTDNPNKPGDCEWDANRFHDFKKTTGQDIADQFRKNRRRRSITGTFYSDDIMDYEERSFFVDEKEAKYALFRIRSRRSVIKNVMSSENATKHCRAVIEDSTAGKTCSDVPGFNVTSAMAECITDLKLTGDIKFAGAAFDSMKEACEEVALKNVSLYKADASGKLEPPTEIGDNLCPGDCSGHGNCTNRTCICEEGYTSDDCSMAINAVPELLGIYDGGLCDIRKRPCKKTDIFGRDFINSENITCHIKEFKVASGGWMPKTEIIKESGTMIDIFGVRCNLPDPPTKFDEYDSEGTPAGGLLISISNDGERTSRRQMRFVSFDSVCMACNKTGNCSFKGDSCLIRGHCFSNNETNPLDWCQQCMPGNDEHSWTRRKVNHPPAFAKGQSPRYAIVGESLPLQLNATDPDNRPVIYSLLSTTATSGYTLSSSGLLKLNVTVQKNQDFTIQATDECNATDTITVTVRILVCPCKNGGQCSPHPYHPRGSGMYSCNCPTGFTGDKCETNVNDCASVNCGNGTCIDGVNNYTCQCDVGFKGSSCDQKIHKCTNQSCFAGVQCTETPSGISCGPCPIGMTGDGKTCTVPTTTSQPTTEAPTTTRPPTTTAATTKAPTTTRPPTTTAATTTHPPTTTAATTNAPTTTHPPTTTAATTKETSTETTTTKKQTTTALPTEEKTTRKDTTPVKTEEPATDRPTTVDTEEPPTTEYIPEENKINAEISLKMDWKDVYQDKQSEEYRSLVDRVEKEIFSAYRKENRGKTLKEVRVISLRSGSIIVKFQLVFETSPNDPLLPLKDSIRDGTLGNFKVDANSLKVIKDKSDNTKDNKFIIILVPVAIAVTLIVIVIAVLFFRSKRYQHYRLRKRSSVCVTNIYDDHERKEKIEMQEGWTDDQKTNMERNLVINDMASASHVNASFQN